MSKRSPNLISVSSINADGSHRSLHPADVHGPFTRWRRVVAALLIILYCVLPWIQINGFPAVFLDVVNGRFHLLGWTLVTEDLWLGFFLITGLAFALFYVTAFIGRIWCGWSCPYTVFLEHLFRRVERWIDGDAAARRKLDEAPWTALKVFKRTLKHTLYVLLAFFVSQVFLRYFVSIRQLYGWMRHSPVEHSFAFAVTLFLASAMYFAFSWFREQFCVIMCPYGRLQSALTDEHTVVIGYDKRRGEPRGKVSTPGAGDCINCMRCVQVCPTGIDIRNGLQLECIGCAACVDACDDIMTKVGRSKGLVRYASQANLDGSRTRFIRPRTLGYTAFALIGLIAVGVSVLTLKPLGVLVKRMQGQPYFVVDGTLRNQFDLQLTNKRHRVSSYKISLESNSAQRGMQLVGAEDSVEVSSLEEVEKAVIVVMPLKNYQGAVPIRFQVTEIGSGLRVTQEVEFLGPDLRFSQLPQ